MSFDGAIKALSLDALKNVKDGYVLGLGSGRAATVLVKLLSKYIKTKKISVECVPTSMQIKLIAEKGGLQLIDAEQIDKIDLVFDGADQIDKNKFLIKGGGGALLKENILISAAKKVIIIADNSKFVKDFNRTVPIEIHPLARQIIWKKIEKIGGKPELRILDRGYPFFTENSNIILDCDFGIIKNPKALQQKLLNIAGVIEVGIFTRKPDIIYKAKANGKFEILT
ncbi:MAG: ribose 5-phosphate isomerase A [Candidatus Nitrosopelagicus sp.]|jgi:ribose 5-phosphate isomerase A|nr:ribose 5-phosphate isomerase A [Candidatus Nitrosopelagicus sp.]MBT5170916.1 ribose 5-phosphate isomerase A [Candidatus Nitrosopelagicus sp.]MBT6647491.1 ribose 5-phosphate isomerase A [Nitrososphaerota archaeon]MBT7253011.1 ribose 5-phosphate isomerase A [Candidatus Nitrosopelagicus sp.]